MEPVTVSLDVLKGLEELWMVTITISPATSHTIASCTFILKHKFRDAEEGRERENPKKEKMELETKKLKEGEWRKRKNMCDCQVL